MALQLKQLVQVDISGDYIWSTNKTGAYDAVDNPGGFGAPNPELLDSALLVIAKRKDEFLTRVGSLIKYSAAAANDDEDQWQLNYPARDGHIQVWMMRLWVSEDAIIDTSGNHALEEGDFFFIPGQPDKVWLKNGSGSEAYEEVTDLNVLIDSSDATNPYMVMCEDLFYNHLAMKVNDFGKDKIQARQREDDRQVEEFRNKITDLTQGIQSADYAFRGGLTDKANDIIESLSDEYLS